MQGSYLNYIVRPLSEADLSAVMAIECEHHFSPLSRSVFERALHGSYQGWVIVNTQERVCGYMLVSSVLDETELLNITIDKSCQRQGLAYYMLEFLEKTLNEPGSIFLEVRESNKAAVSLYERAGYAEIGQRPGYYPTEIGREDALIYAKYLVNE